jgi:hypothetical protein
MLRPILNTDFAPLGFGAPGFREQGVESLCDVLH